MTFQPTSGGSFRRSSSFPQKWAGLGRVLYWLRARYRHFRVGRLVTRMLGPQYRRSRTLLEIDITYLCNLRCINCNRSCRQAPEALHMEVWQLRAWIDDWLARGQRWDRIRVLGGEPTLHPQFGSIIAELERYRAWNPGCGLEVVTNGHGQRVRRTLASLPKHVWVENSNKTGPLQSDFGPFNLAPCDDPAYRGADYRNGCAIMEECGMGLTPFGYFPCAVAGGIERITGEGTGREILPAPEDDMLSTVASACALCGRFRDGHFVPKNLRPRLTEAQVSPTWERLYSHWHKGRGDRSLS